jgi:hypothetical protein
MLSAVYAECHIKAPYDDYQYAECPNAERPIEGSSEKAWTTN